MKRQLAFLLCVIMLVLPLSVFSYAEGTECNHNYEWVYPAGSSCEDPDRLFLYKCTKCGDVSDSERVIAAQHVIPDDEKIILPATIDSEGLARVKCINCDYVESERVLPALVPEDNFSDVPGDAWFKHAVSYTNALHIFNGVGENLFSPGGSMTRAMFVTAAGNIFSKDRDKYTSSSFTDVPAGAWYESSVAWASANNIVAGMGEGKFAPNLSITREQAARILRNLARYAGIDTSCTDSLIQNFTDGGNTSSWAVEDVNWALSRGIMNGKGEGILDPRGTATRAENAQLMTMFFSKIYLPSIKTAPNDVKYIAGTRYLAYDPDITDEENTTAPVRVNSPVKKELAFTFDKSWESEDVVYHSLVKLPDGGYRMYYKATSDRRRICYIESTDGKTWTRPSLSTLRINGAKTNCVTNNNVNPDNLYVFYDTNPACPDDERWKGVYGQWGDGLFLEYSYNNGNFFEFWTQFGNTEVKMMGTPEETGGCYFDTLNTVHWDAEKGKYVAFVRGFHIGNNYNLSKDIVATGNASRDIRYAESDDCIHWTTPVPITYNDNKDYQMYANCITPYGRDTGLYIGIPTRYNRTSYSTYTDNLFIFSHDLQNWMRFDTPYLLPNSNISSFTYGDCYPCVGWIENDDGDGVYYSTFMKEKGSDGIVRLYRYDIRAEGFASVSADSETAVLSTRYLSFEGSGITVNAKTRDDGYIRIGLIDRSGAEVAYVYITGDTTDFVIDLGDLIEKYQNDGIKLVFEMKNADLYSFKFV